MSARYIIRHSPDSRGCGAILAVFGPHSQQGSPATATLDNESRRLPCLAADTKTSPGAQPSGVLKKLDRLLAGINLEPDMSIAKVNLVASSVLFSNDGGGRLALQGAQD
jgi:hypothetical protein